MLLPSKLFCFNESTLAFLPTLLRILEEPKTPQELFMELRATFRSPLDLLDALDCLYALGRIELNDEEGRIVRCLEK